MCPNRHSAAGMALCQLQFRSPSTTIRLRWRREYFAFVMGAAGKPLRRSISPGGCSDWNGRHGTAPFILARCCSGRMRRMRTRSFCMRSGGAYGAKRRMCSLLRAWPLLGKSWQAVLTEFQRGGFLLTYVAGMPARSQRRRGRGCRRCWRRGLPALLARIRRSLKPKRIVLISRLLEPLLASMREADTGCPVILSDGGKSFALDGAGRERCGCASPSDFDCRCSEPLDWCGRTCPVRRAGRVSGLAATMAA